MINTEGISELDDAKDIVVITIKESEELEVALNNKFLSHTRYTAGDGEDKFLIYETECEQCKN